MDAILAMNLVSMGSNVLGKVADACSSAVSSVSSATSSSSTTFDSVLKSEVATSTNKYAAMDSETLTTEKASLQKKLCACDDVKDFVGKDKSFKISQSGDGYVIERADGRMWHIPSDSDAAAAAKEYCDCSVAQARLDGNPVTGLRSTWTVTMEA